MLVVVGSPTTSKSTNRRLRPLYLAVFFQNLVFWYAVEKLFLDQIGLTNTEIGVALAIMLTAIVLLEVPAGFLGDLTSRKRVFVIANFFLALTAAIGTVANSFLVYTIALVLWACYAALESGLIEAMVFDTCLDEEQEDTNYEIYFGKARIYSTIGLVLGAASSSLFTTLLDVRANYPFSIITATLSILVITRFREPSLHRVSETGILNQTKKTIGQLFTRKTLLPLVVASVLVGLLTRVFFEWHQVFWSELGLQASLFGLLGVVSLSAPGFAGWLAPRLKSIPMWLYAIPVLLGLIFLTTNNIVLVTISLVIGLTFTLTASYLLGGRLNREITSDVRTSVGSVIGFLGSTVSVPTIILLGRLTDSASIRAAGITIVILMAMFVIAERIASIVLPQSGHKTQA